ncbi:hypothetical protein [Candidatus Nitronereus thalassa]|uniref:Uncharacterized protein n=1 Tax=Candidatus Nitronereus thalassa TaxID=3020898 RepID=A0ABU3K386_9BACT|nr:hypothetical protein [Candidatus Nitronereus thalassa]MDT7040850.1 hypothetical protein [Candidatus Nitronereus thalassa]
MSARAPRPLRGIHGNGQDLQRLRERLGLPQHQPGEIACLRCDREFFSRDMRKERLCKPCKWQIETSPTEEYEYSAGPVRHQLDSHEDSHAA